MSRRAGNVLALIMGVVAISSTRADVLNFAREWSSRKDENKTITSPPQPQADQHSYSMFGRIRTNQKLSRQQQPEK